MWKLNIKKDWKNQRNLLIVDVSAVMRTRYLQLFTPSELRFMGANARYQRVLSYEVDGETVNTSSIYGLMQLFQMYGTNCDYIFCFDAPKNLLKKINANYKNNRVKMDSDYYDQVNTMYRWLTDVGFRTMFFEGYEGDHMIHKAVQENYDTYDNIAIITNDKDLSVLVDDKVVWVDTLKKRSDINKENYPEVVGCPYNMVVLYKSMVGDPSDNIKGIYRFGKVAFSKFIEKEELYGKPVRGKERFIIENSENLTETQKAQAIGSYQLVEPLEVPSTVEGVAIPTDRVNIMLHKQFLQKFGLKSIDKLFKVDL